jgi:hypothetical protein
MPERGAHDMRIVSFEGRPVKKQSRTQDNRVKVFFYDGSTTIVSGEEWKTKAESRFYADGVRRSDIVRTTT